ncbi:MAG: carboxylesterase/lipase family protein [Bryobacteraceae bacterium]
MPKQLAFRSICALSCALAVGISAFAADRVKTGSGVVEGMTAAKSHIHIYKGIPYAAPPVGALRWEAPHPVKHWTGVRQATQFGARCMQGRLFADMVFRDSGPSEDCLYLNVWTLAASPRARLPVMVWIYGGGFQAGASSEPRQDGKYLAQKGVVVVSMNYRLGIFGFMAYPGLKEDGHDASGDYGLLDQVAALRWVRRNIAAFGGDPHKVTIFGESAGSFSVSALVASPLARGLFERAIGESGAMLSVPGRPEQTLQKAEAVAQKFGASIGANSLAALRAVPAQALLDDVLKDRKNGFGFWPDIDGYFLPESATSIYHAGKQNHVALLAGWNQNEGGIGGGKPPATVQSWTARAHALFPNKAGEFLKVFPAADDKQARQSADAFSADMFIALGTWEWVQAQQATGESPVYRYHFEQAPPMKKGVPSRGAYHSSEIEYVFETLASKDLPWRPGDWKVSHTMSSYWTNFAKSGNPNGKGLPHWPAYNVQDDDQVMHLRAGHVHAAPATDAAQMEFLEKNAPAKGSLGRQ